MKKTHFFFILIFCLPGLTAQNYKEKAELLSKYYTLSISDTSINNKLTFFNVFPNNFKDFCSIYGYDSYSDTLILSPLYEKSLDHICLFCNLCGVVSPEYFYQKIINIVKDGYWQADAVNYLKSCLTSHLLSEVDTLFLCPQTYHSTMAFLSTLDSYPMKIQIHFWKFFFDAQCIDYKDFENIYNNIQKFAKFPSRLYRVIKKGYKSVNNNREIIHDNTGKVYYPGNTKQN